MYQRGVKRKTQTQISWINMPFWIRYVFGLGHKTKERSNYYCELSWIIDVICIGDYCDSKESSCPVTYTQSPNTLVHLCQSLAVTTSYSVPLGDEEERSKCRMLVIRLYLRSVFFDDEPVLFVLHVDFLVFSHGTIFGIHSKEKS